MIFTIASEYPTTPKTT